MMTNKRTYERWPGDYVEETVSANPVTIRLPSQQELVAILRQHKLKLGRVKRAFAIGSFARGTANLHSDLDVLLEVAPPTGWTAHELENEYRRKIAQKFVDLGIRGHDDSLHPQWQGRRIDVYFTEDANLESRAKIQLNKGKR